ncbi:MAG: FliH/SctL family protein [Chloroflexi bacterium]|nr:FliH/SctL family protein [Chloroflexota bacterium]
MSCSNIIKLHSLRTQRVLVGPHRTGRSPGFTAFPGRTGDQPIYDPGEIADRESGEPVQAVGWVAEAQDIVNQARSMAEVILDESRNKSDEVRQLAHQEGYQAGYSEGMVAARSDILEHSKRIGELARNAVVDSAGILGSLEEGIVDLALAIGEKIVNRRLAEDRSLVLSMVKGALEYVDVMDVIRVRVNPEDLEVLRSHWEESQGNSTAKQIELAADAGVEVGGCIIDTRSSVVDAQIRTKLDEIEKAFRSELNSSTR